MKRLYLFIFFATLLLTIIGCSNSGETTEYTSLSQTEIDQFIQEKNIKPLAIEEVQNTTVILYNNGIYYLSKDNEELIENYAGWSGGGLEKVQLGMTSTGSPHAHIILNDEALLKEAYKVEAVFHDGKSVVALTEGNRGFLLFYDKNKKNMNLHNELDLYIYDKNGDVLYQSNL